jgi:hypothetical protein
VVIQHRDFGFEAETHLKTCQEFGPYRKEKAARYHYKDKLVNDVEGLNRYLY